MGDVEAEMARAIAESELDLNDSKDDPLAVLQAELDICRQQLAHSQQVQQQQSKQQQKDADALQLYKKKCESLKEARKKFEVASNLRLSRLQQELETTRSQVQATAQEVGDW